jgi:hypothetical protein
MPVLHVGCSLSDGNRADLPHGLSVPSRLADYARRFQSHIAPDFFFELAPEEHWTTPVSFPDQFVARETNRWWHTWHDDARLGALFKSPQARVGVHQSVSGRDALSSNFFQKFTAIEETKQAMLFAHSIGASYFVFHLATLDRWDWDRRDQINKALKIFKVYAAFYHASNFKFTPCIEILEYPKFPATGGEAIALLNKCREILPETKLAFDISHLWGSRQRLMATKMWTEEGGPGISFVDTLEYTLSRTWDDIHVFHLGGCWESETHAVPGLHPQQDPIHFPMKLREPSNVYAEAHEMDLNRVLDLLLNYSIRRGRDLNLVLEIFNRDFMQVTEAVRVIRADLNARLAEPPAVLAPAKAKAKTKPTSRRKLQTPRAKKAIRQKKK